MTKEKQETCDHCGQSMSARKVTLLRKKKGKIYSFTDTPAQVCPDCGERWFASETLKMMDEMIRGKLVLPHHAIEAIEYSFSAKSAV